MVKDKLILASGSPRRRELSSIYFSTLEVYRGDLGEPVWTPGTPPKEYLIRCVKTKWANALTGVRESADKSPYFLLVGDTVVTWADRILGKPSNARQAEEMLAELSGRTHFVWTGFRIGRFENHEPIADSGVRVVESAVTFHKLTRDEIRAYVRRDRPLDKAGAYGFQDGALRFVAKVRGSYSNIVGLPIFDVMAAAYEIGAK